MIQNYTIIELQVPFAARTLARWCQNGYDNTDTPPRPQGPYGPRGRPNHAQTPECVSTQGVQVKEGERGRVEVGTTVASAIITFTRPRGHQSRVGAIRVPSDINWNAS